MDVPQQSVFEFADFQLNVEGGVLHRAGEQIHLRQKAFQVLAHLVINRSRVVPKSELHDTIWSSTFVTDDVLVQCVAEIRRKLGDDSHQPRFIKTTPKFGYRFIGQVHPGPDATGHPDVPANDETKAVRQLLPKRQWGVGTVLAIGIAILLAISLYVAATRSSDQQRVSLPVVQGRQSIAVMFFSNSSGSTHYAWLREGLADMLIAGLSRSQRLTVLNRGQLSRILERHHHQGMEITTDTAREIAASSAADYFIEGVFFHVGDAIRVDVQLRETRSGEIMTVESATAERPDQLLSIIDLIALKLASRLGASPERSIPVSDITTNSLEAYRYYSLGVEKAHGLHSVDAIDLLQRAIRLDPEFAMAHARIGYVYAISWGDVEKGKPHLQKAFQLTSRLTEKDRMSISAWFAIANLDFAEAIRSYRQLIDKYPLETEAYSRLARLLRGEGKADEAIEVLRLGLAVDPEAGDLHNALGTTLSGKGRHAEAIAAHQQYVALEPDEPNAYDSLGLSYQAAGRYSEALENYQQAITLDPTFEIAIVHLANTFYCLGRYREAAAAFERYVSAGPSEGEKLRGREGLAFIYLAWGRIEDAERQVRLLDGPTWTTFEIAIKRGDMERARSVSDELETQIRRERGSRPNRRFDHYYRGLSELYRGNTEKAMEYFRLTLEAAAPTWHWNDFEDCMAKAFFMLGRYDEAIGEYRRILAKNPSYPLAEFHLAEALTSAGQSAEARQAYERFLLTWSEADRDIPEVDKALRMIGS